MREAGRCLRAAGAGGVVALVLYWLACFVWLGCPPGFWVGLGQELWQGTWDRALLTACALSAAGLLLARAWAAWLPGAFCGGALGSGVLALCLAGRALAERAPAPGLEACWPELALTLGPFLCGGGLAAWLGRPLGEDLSRPE